MLHHLVAALFVAAVASAIGLIVGKAEPTESSVDEMVASVAIIAVAVGLMSWWRPRVAVTAVAAGVVTPVIWYLAESTPEADSFYAGLLFAEIGVLVAGGIVCYVLAAALGASVGRRSGPC